MRTSPGRGGQFTSHKKRRFSLKKHSSFWSGLRPLFATFLLASVVSPLAEGGTFSIVDIKPHRDGGILTQGITKPGANPMQFVPQMEVSIETTKDLRTRNLYVRAYFFDSSNRIIQSDPAPGIAYTVDPDDQSIDYAYQIPTILKAGKAKTVYFPFPDKLPDDWKVVVVFGGRKGAVAAVSPSGDERDFVYPEQALVQQTLLNPDKEDDSDDTFSPLIEQVALSENPDYPKFTLFLHLPHGITNPHDVKGVFAQCMLANSVQAIRDTLNKIDPYDDHYSMYAYAESHQMAVLAWGGGRGADGGAGANYDQLDKDQLKYSEASFQQIADAWDRAVQALVHDYGMPDHDFLMNGWSSAGEWADRLALHKPDRFRAVHIHVASKYDAPNPNASHVLWLLTSGELDP
jgi:hypothetical protein